MCVCTSREAPGVHLRLSRLDANQNTRSRYKRPPKKALVPRFSPFPSEGYLKTHHLRSSERESKENHHDVRI